MAEPGGGASLFDQLPRTVMPGDDVTEVARAVKGPLRAGACATQPSSPLPAHAKRRVYAQ